MPNSRSCRTTKLTHECRQQDSRIANPHGAALIACSAWLGNVKRNMKMQLKCDGCGKVGTSDEIYTDHDGRDLCATCAQSAKLSDLKQQHASKKEWLESTHLKELRELEKQIADIERELPNVGAETRPTKNHE